MLIAGILLSPGLAMGGERDLLELWRKHTEALHDHSGMAAACRLYGNAHPDDPLLPVVRHLQAWHILKAGRTAEGSQLLKPYLAAGDGAVHYGARRLAKAWITRDRREQVTEVLQAYYRKHVRYPQDLDELVDHPELRDGRNRPLTDLWGNRWQYRLVGFGGVSGFLDQKYELVSLMLEASSDLDSALAVPYAGTRRIAPLWVTKDSQGMPLVKLEWHVAAGSPTQVAMIALGEEAKGVFLAYVGKDLIILCDYLHWYVLVMGE